MPTREVLVLSLTVLLVTMAGAAAAIVVPTLIGTRCAATLGMTTGNITRSYCSQDVLVGEPAVNECQWTLGNQTGSIEGVPVSAVLGQVSFTLQTNRPCFGPAGAYHLNVSIRQSPTDDAQFTLLAEPHAVNAIVAGGGAGVQWSFNASYNAHQTVVLFVSP
jgi:hypothetical protein